MINVREIFEKYNSDDEYLEFDRVENKYSSRADLNAFILLDKLISSGSNIISAASHDLIFLEVSISDLAKVATEKDILTLVRSGVLYDQTYDSLTMYK